MNPTDYTLDAICQSMGLGGFLEGSWLENTLRVLFKPSFDPEVCVTLKENGEPNLEVIAAREMIWHLASPHPVATYREQAYLASSHVNELIDSFRVAVNAHQSEEGRMIVLDGMQIAGHLDSAENSVAFEDHPYRTESSCFTRTLIRRIWKSSSTPGIKNALARCGKYVSIELPLEKLSESPPSSNVTVIGNENERSELLNKIKKQSPN